MQWVRVKQLREEAKKWLPHRVDLLIESRYMHAPSKMVRMVDGGVVEMVGFEIYGRDCSSLHCVG